LWTSALVAAIGVAVALTIAWIHAQLDASGGAYTSFCNVNSSINCDRVLTSPFAKLFGVPVAWFAIAAYVGIAAAFVLAARSPQNGRTWIRLAALGVVGGAAFSLWMAYVSFSILNTVCLMCMGLYAVVIALLALISLTAPRFDRAFPDQAPLLPRTALPVAFAVSLAAVALVVRADWPDGPAALGTGASLADLEAQDPEFYAWYTQLPVSRVPMTGQHFGAGNPNAPVVIVEFSDFDCGHCRKNHGLMKDLAARRPEDVYVVHRHFPLDAACNEAVERPIHPHSCRAAEAAECAGKQGKYDEMADRLFEYQNQLFIENLYRQAGKIGLNETAFRACMESRETLPKIIADTRVGNGLKITSTPTFFINGRRVRGTFDSPARYDFAVLVEKNLADARD
jgi:protein-disulfide isomerase